MPPASRHQLVYPCNTVVREAKGPRRPRVTRRGPWNTPENGGYRYQPSNGARRLWRECGCLGG